MASQTADPGLAFLNACSTGDAAALQGLLSSTTLETLQPHSAGGFIKACRNGHLPVVESLLEAFSAHWVATHKPTTMEDMPEGLPASFIIAFMRDRGYDDPFEHRPPSAITEGFSVAAGAGHLNIVRVLLELTGPLQVNVNCTAEAYTTPFAQACMFGHADIVDLLLTLQGDRAADPNRCDGNALAMACINGHMDIVQKLLALTGPQTVDPTLDRCRAFYDTCGEGHLDIVKLLLSLTGPRRIDVHAYSERGLRSAACGGHTDVVRLLLSLDGDRLARLDLFDYEVLRLPARRGHEAIVREVLGVPGQRAVPQAVIDDAAGDTPLDLHAIQRSVKWSGTVHRWRRADMVLFRAGCRRT